MTREAAGSRAALGMALALVAGMWMAGCGNGGEAVPTDNGESPNSIPSPPMVDSRGREVGDAAGTRTAPTEGELAWTAPESWVAEPPSSSMRRAQYTLPRAEGDVEDGVCAVFYFGPGQGGNVDANISRWASQFEAGPEGPPPPKVAEESVNDLRVLKIAIEGTYNPSPMAGGGGSPKPDTLLLGAIVVGPDANWFFKCTGPKKTMASHQSNFDGLVHSVRFQ